MKEFLDSEAVSQVLPEVYKDAVQPAAKELGKGLVVVAKTVNLALEPLKGVLWGYDELKGFLINAVSPKLKDVPKEQIVPPPLNVAGPLVESMRFSAQNEDLKDMYASLLKTSMVQKEAHKAHPSFVEIIRQLSPDEAKIIKHIVNHCTLPEIHHAVINVGREDFVFEELREKFYSLCDEVEISNKSLIPSYLDNLRRLQLIEFDQKLENEVASKPEYVDAEFYSDLSGHIRYDDIETRRFEFFKATEYGMQFFQACV